MSLKLLPVIFYWILYCAAGFSQQFGFLSEKIKIEINGGYCELEGSYSFQNTDLTSSQSPIYYPFVINEFLPYPDSISVYNVKDERPVQFSKSRFGITFPVKVPPNSISQYKVFYRQKTSFQKMEYILTTTRAWKRPLSSAEFIIKIPKNFSISFLSYKADKIEHSGDYLSYYIKKNNFFPDHNLIIRWEKVRGQDEN